MDRAMQLKFSKKEIEFVNRIMSTTGLPDLPAEIKSVEAKRNAYRFFNSSGDAGVDLCLFSLADTLTVHGPSLDPEIWSQELIRVQKLLNYYWDEFIPLKMEPGLVDGNDLITKLNKPPGPWIRQILGEIEERTATGEITSKEEALVFIGQWNPVRENQDTHIL